MMRKNIIAVISCILSLSMLLIGCGSAMKSDTSYAVAETAAASEEWYGANDSNSNGAPGKEEIAWDDSNEIGIWNENADTSGTVPGNDFVRETQNSEKLVYTCNINMETLEFTKTVSTLKELIKKYDGFIESETQSDASDGWYYSSYEKTSGTLSEYVVVRIPTDKYNSFLDDLDGTGKITEKSQNVENITKQYNNTATTIKSLETQEARLLEMMEQAETIEDMLYIEDRLSDVQNELAMYKNELSEMDTDVQYSTVTLTINEVLEYTRTQVPVKTSTFMDRLKNTLRNTWSGFLDFLEGFLFFLIEITPVLLFLGAFGGIIALIIVKSVKASRKRKAKKAEKKAAEIAEKATGEENNHVQK